MEDLIVDGAASQSLKLIAAVYNSGPPGFVIKIPLHGFTKSGAWILFGLPAQITFDLGSINGVAQIMPGPIFDKGNLFLVRYSIRARAEFVKNST